MSNRVAQRRLDSTPTASQADNDRAAVEALVRQAARGNREALKVLCETISRSVAFRVMSRLRNRADAEDVTQEVLLRVCEKIGSLKKAAAFEGWLNTIIINETNRYLKRNTKRAEILNIDDYLDCVVDEDEDFLPEEYVIREEDRRTVTEIVGSLPERQWEAVMLYYYKGMSVVEAAEVMGITNKGVSRYLVIARGKIKNELAKRSKKTGTLNSATILPVGALLTQVLREEAAQTTLANEAWIIKAIASADSVARTAEILRRLLTGGGIAAAALVALLVISPWDGSEYDPSTLNPLPLSIPAIQSASDSVTDGTTVVTKILIVYLDEEANETGEINPRYASVDASNEYGELTVLQWWITPFNSEGILYSGQGDFADETFVHMQDNKEDGDYLLCFLLKDALGTTYNVKRHFEINAHLE